MTKKEQLTTLIERYKHLGIDSQIDYERFYLYSIITHSTAIEGSTVTEIENQLLFDQGITAKGKTLMEQMMNVDLKRAYEESISLAENHTDITIDILKSLSHLVMQNTGTTYKTALGDFSSANGDLRIVNVTAGVGGRSYLSYQKVPSKLQDFCDWLNNRRKSPMSMAERYDLSFEAHYRLVTIHPWADGNGRMARLIMNYIHALIAAQETEDSAIFLEFMTGEMIKILSSEIDLFLESISGDREKIQPIGDKKLKSREKILQLLKEHPNYSARKLAEVIGITPKAVEKQIAKLKAEGLIRRDGPDKGGSWVVL